MGQSIVIHGLIKKRGEIAGQHKVALKAADALKDDLDAIDRALVLCGYEDDPKGIAPRGKYKQLFGRTGVCGGWPNQSNSCCNSAGIHYLALACYRSSDSGELLCQI